MWSCGSLTFSGQVFKKILPFILVSTSAQLCKGYLANCYRRNEWHIWTCKCSGLLLLMRSAKDITACWWCSKGWHIYLICLFNTLLNFGFRQGQSIFPYFLKPKRMPLKCENMRSFNLKLASTESHFSSSNKWPKSVLSYGVKLERRGAENGMTESWRGCGFVEQLKRQFRPRWRGAKQYSKPGFNCLNVHLHLVSGLNCKPCYVKTKF